MKIIVRSNETGCVVEEFSALTQAACDDWVAENYNVNDYSWHYE